jgi:hypothetical protein
MGEMLPLETKQSGGKLLPHSDLGRGLFLEEVSRFRKQKRDILLGTWNVRSLWIFKKWDVGVRTGLGWRRIGIRGGRL